MDYLFLLLALSFLWISLRYLAARKLGPLTLPPGPRPFPVLGNILEPGKKPHQALTKLSETYGPIMTLKLGSLTTILISSPDIAKEAFHKHDQALSSRTILDSLRALDHHKFSIVYLPVSPPWRNLRKVCATKIFSTKRLDASEAMRCKKVQELLDNVQENCNSGSAVDIGQAAFTTVLNSISNTFFSIDLAHHESDLSQSFHELACCIMEEAGNPNLADYFPILQFVDPQGSRKRMTSYFARVFEIFDDIINQRLQVRASSTECTEIDDVLDSLINLVEENSSEFSFNHIKHLLLDLLFAGIDTTSSTVEWAMAELLRNPEKLAKAQNELRGLVGMDGIDEIVEDFAMSKFPYLQAVVKETLRLQPPVPFLVPHKAETEVDICGFRVPKNAQILVNVWAMGRDS
ncbi:Cytochrome P450 family protein [Melia azedarach]|uniref:Cytochrome P450 family protein n=1 Tax=Melia azedarach TaxID=155640 RepID=A0ACC1YU77_MELAZ|nr:Cytochrome P450 family protein [Melia azedarach]